MSRNLLTGFLCLLFIFPIFVTATGEESMPQFKYYLVKLIGTRPTWPDDMTRDEEKIMSEHFVYLRDLASRKKVLMAGPVFEFKFGLIVLKVQSEEEAIEIMSNEPSVMKGIHTYEMSEMVASIMAESMPAFQYPSEISDKILKKEIEIKAPVSEVWNAWTTEEGLKSFFSPNVHIEMRIGGPYEIYFAADQPYGIRGSEGCKILSYLPEKLLSFEWNAPPKFGELRYKHTQVVIHFEETDSGGTRLNFAQYGWGKGEKWDEIYDYFDRAWDYVLGNLKKSIEDDSEN